MSKFLSLIILWLLANGCWLMTDFCYAGETVLSQIQKGNELYEAEKYAEAVSQYEAVLGLGVKSAGLYYNLGNAYYRNRQLGRTILSYERSFRLAPGDKDIRFNLEYARASLKEPSTPALTALLEKMDNLFSLNGLTVFFSLFYFLFLAGLIVKVLTKTKRLFWINIGLGIWLFLSGLWLSFKIYNQQIVQSAIVLSSQECRNGPGEEYSVGFTVPAGKKVVVLQEERDWYAVGLPREGLKGWLRKESLEKI